MVPKIKTLRCVCGAHDPKRTKNVFATKEEMDYHQAFYSCQTIIPMAKVGREMPGLVKGTFTLYGKFIFQTEECYSYGSYLLKSDCECPECLAINDQWIQLYFHREK